MPDQNSVGSDTARGGPQHRCEFRGARLMIERFGGDGMTMADAFPSLAAARLHPAEHSGVEGGKQGEYVETPAVHVRKRARSARGAPGIAACSDCFRCSRS